MIGPLCYIWEGSEKHRGKKGGIRNRLRTQAHHPPLPSILLSNVQSLENKLDDLRARVTLQRDVRDCNILCFTETWLSPMVPDQALTPSDSFLLFCMDRNEASNKSKGGGVCLMVNRKWCEASGVSTLSHGCISPSSADCSTFPDSFHQSSLQRSISHPTWI